MTSWRSLEAGHCSSRDTFPILGERSQIPSHQEAPFWQEMEEVCLHIEPSPGLLARSLSEGQASLTPRSYRFRVICSYISLSPPFPSLVFLYSLHPVSLVIPSHLLARGIISSQLSSEKMKGLFALVNLESSYSEILLHDKENKTSQYLSTLCQMLC